MEAHLGVGPGAADSGAVDSGAADSGAAAVPGPPRLTRRLDERLTRLGVTGRFTRDCLLAAVATVLTFVLVTTLFWAVAQTEGLPFEVTRVRLIIAVCCVQAVLLCLRRIRPLLCLALVVGIQIFITALIPPDTSLHGIPPLVAAYTVATLLPVRTAFLIAGAAVAVETVVSVALLTVTHPDLLLAVIGDLVSAALAYLGAAFVGSYVATRRRYTELVRAQADEAIKAQRAKVQAAIGAERSRMARELHDVAAHHLSGMVVQASAVERLIDRDPAAAKDGVTWIRTQGKETLDNLRLVVGVLRGRRAGDGDDAADHAESNAPVPGLAVLDDLVQTARELTTPVELVREGELREVPPVADVALYRMVQESLSNARQHAPGAPVRVVVRYLPREVSLEVTNAPAAGRPEPRVSSGVGLIGMRERAQLIGAEFTAGRTAAGGWCVMVSLPTVRDGTHVLSAAATSKGNNPA